MEKESIKKHKFQFTTANMENRRNWLRAGIAKLIAKGLLDGAFDRS